MDTPFPWNDKAASWLRGHWSERAITMALLGISAFVAWIALTGSLTAKALTLAYAVLP